MTFVMLTRLAPGAMRSPSELEVLEKQLMSHIRTRCPEVEWMLSLAVLGPYDYLDVFKAPDLETATRISTMVRTFGHAQTEIWPGVDWRRFKDLVRNLTDSDEDSWT
ncbi:MAG TPA: GYD domain-containing protein [Kofleriaceae bacterium]|nr:GYD domain-containing protein [Kofleriaceae bacterium]